MGGGKGRKDGRKEQVREEGGNRGRREGGREMLGHAWNKWKVRGGRKGRGRGRGEGKGNGVEGRGA